ncbi:hypothetical protein CONCODRAFT_78230 [Conidiobolus coronatus NRRL 28638]|uniref:Serine hydrolase domain-containing protein n=1 Tax=Conidiobolus coronatus (strain ATCC 28846 / CBS 209.66 / NRRL 28638) TaxID=796925 RepID=A0A137P9K4_CONC2|nr:hypothetical protein CONCODRAFT_78230 [Conidiobolus coronatus NRRL 28638]|eukprot:KXN71662.1 hypothetical protein CONCODRAFT_78230 [Conidiobolus coronatus NRRL 28638]
MSLPKVLCLHGIGQNKTIMAKKTKFIRDKFKNKVKFVYATGSYALPEEHPIILGFNEYIKKNGLEDRKNQFERFATWFPLSEDYIADYIPALNHICKILKEEGPFVGVFGFSEGAIAATFITKLLEVNHQLIKSANHPPLKFSIMLSGVIPQDDETLKLFKVPVITPSLHMYSNVDNIVKPKFSIENASYYTNPIIVEHNLGHIIPSAPQYLSIMTQFICMQLSLNSELQSTL